ncbi:adenylate cyclase [Amycolatopsis deserti]|uniref:Adenylate cyclase n=1 Tax=Amycolatopsis deserti TaxID=185696 RepID=A0ABQ3JCD1_9PSEU|nr:FAD/NAD(P)-binding protein [Amycolatopsis deserti]GHF12321.1 adenylate cyclase [Amycolatopsis deserti]
MAPSQLAIVGAGPRGVGVLERLSANAAELLGPAGLVVHLIDPFPPGAGRIWRYEQSPLLRMNSMAEDVTMFTDDTVTMEGPVRTGPSLWQWAQEVRAGRIRYDVPEDLREELSALRGTSFPTRRLASAYLDWVYRHVLAGLAPGIEVVEHRTRATRIDETRVWLAGVDEPLDVDAIVLAVGHLDAEPGSGERELAEFAAAHGLAYYPAGYTADVDYQHVAPGEPVLVRGFGLAFVDLMLLLTEGRGGRFAEHAGGLVYHPSGAEPVLHIGSRRGVPYHAKPGYRLQGSPLRLPRFFGPERVSELLARDRQLDFRADVWPHVAKELAWGYYSELFTAHPSRVRMSFADFSRCFAEFSWDSAEMRALVRRAVPAEEDRLDLERLDRPLAGLRFETAEEFGKYLRSYVEADLARRADPAHSADLGAFMALLSAYQQMPALMASGALDVSDVDGWWHGFFSYYASGPPPRRLQELLALHEAGVVSFLGADVRISLDPSGFVASSGSFPGSVTARTLIEARLPSPSVSRASDGLLAQLLGAGELAEEHVREQPSGRIATRVTDGRLLDAAGRPHSRRFALGPHTSARSAAAFTRPRTNGPSFRQNDAAAREILRLVRGG